MSEQVKCPVCGKQAQWIGCYGCGDDIGTVSCGTFGAMPGVCLSELERVRRTPEPSVKREWDERRER